MAPFLSLICLMTVGQADPLSDAAKEEFKKLQGTWTIELQDEDGKKLKEADLKGRTISFGQTHFLMRNKTAMLQLGRIKLDPAKKTWNATVDKGAHEGDLLPGLYQLDGDTLKICLSTDGEGRPKEFKSGKDRLLMVCKRVPVKQGEDDLSGNYRSDSIDIAGKRQRYDTIIQRTGDSYLLLYMVKGKLVYIGTGLRKGNFLAVGWMSQGAGVTLFQIEKNRRMVGEFSEVAGPGFLGTETLTPVVDEPLDARR